MAKKPKVTQQRETIFEALARHNPGYGPSPAEKRDNTEVADFQKQMKETREELARLRGENEALQRQMRFRPQAAAKKEEEIPDPSTIDFVTNMPDPAVDHEAFNRELQRRIDARDQLRERKLMQRIESRDSDSRQADELWNRFAGKYPDWAKRPSRVKIVAAELVQEARNKGLDAQSYLVSEEFIDDVARTLETEFGKPKVEKRQAKVEDDEDLDDAGSLEDDDAAGAGDDDDDDGRTAGIFGGTESGGKPARRSAQKEGDMLQDLKDIQLKSGFF